MGDIDQKERSVKKRLSNGTVKEYSYSAVATRNLKVRFENDSEK